VDPEVAVLAERRQQRIRDPADGHLQRRAVRDSLDDVARDRPVALVGLGGRDVDERLIALAPPDQLGRMELVEPLRARHPVVDLDEDGTRPISAAMYSALVPRLK
jgi:hypothetical protein